ncbi:SMI1/KNR4 family protein [Streptomyces adonidis]|uniref:SMI1/KNR4 family protein n=1 Tax=Streptomyces adonidis TaxID=3231367 RepID=UPI0034DACCC4
MVWVDRIVQAVGWQPMEINIAWSDLESRLGTRLPGDFKEFCEVFGAGEFSGYLEVYASSGGPSLKVIDWLEDINLTLREDPEAVETFLPYGIYTPGGKGLLPWGGTVNASEFGWFVDGGSPEEWRVVAQEEMGGWKKFEMSMSEFVFRVLTDVEFEEFTVADLVDPPYFQPEV